MMIVLADAIQITVINCVVFFFLNFNDYTAQTCCATRVISSSS